MKEVELHPFEHDESCAYKIRVYSKDGGGCLCHVGYAVSGGEPAEPLRTMCCLPRTMPRLTLLSKTVTTAKT
ncbi:MAG: hypothetical protein ACOYID_03330 [Eubacteriales bacterium]|nr:hypothetical protein [Clostridiales bacterium]